MKTPIGTIRRWRRRVWSFNYQTRREWVERNAAQIASGSLVMDVGAGSGQYRPLFAHCEYHAHDFAQEESTIGRYTPLDYISDITELPVPDNTFDVVLCTEVLEHVPEPIKAVKELARVLRPGGTLLLTAPLGSFLHQEPYHFYGGYTPHWYRKFLPESDLEVVSIEANHGFFSQFGQETMRYNAFLSPKHLVQLRTPLTTRLFLLVLWILSLPFGFCMPLLGFYLDNLKLEESNTVDYQVVAIKKGRILARA